MISGRGLGSSGVKVKSSKFQCVGSLAIALTRTLDPKLERESGFRFLI